MIEEDKKRLQDAQTALKQKMIELNQQNEVQHSHAEEMKRKERTKFEEKIMLEAIEKQE